jgi:CrcB protein
VILLVIAIGGAAGALARYAVANWALRHWGTAFPYGTLVINVAGSFLLGVVMQLAQQQAINDTTRMLIAVGFCGAFTTFSTFSYENVLLLQQKNWNAVLVYTAASVVVGLLAVMAGLQLAQLFRKAV